MSNKNKHFRYPRLSSNLSISKTRNFRQNSFINNKLKSLALAAYGNTFEKVKRVSLFEALLSTQEGSLAEPG